MFAPVIGPRSGKRHVRSLVPRLVMERLDEATTERARVRLDQADSPAGLQDALAFPKELGRIRQMMQHVQHQNGRRGRGAEREGERRSDDVDVGARTEIRAIAHPSAVRDRSPLRRRSRHETAGCGPIQNRVVLLVVVAIQPLEERLLANETSVDDRGFGGIEIEVPGERMGQQAARAARPPSCDVDAGDRVRRSSARSTGRTTMGTVNGARTLSSPSAREPPEAKWIRLEDQHDSGRILELRPKLRRADGHGARGEVGRRALHGELTDLQRCDRGRRQAGLIGRDRWRRRKRRCPGTPPSSAC